MKKSLFWLVLAPSFLVLPVLFFPGEYWLAVPILCMFGLAIRNPRPEVTVIFGYLVFLSIAVLQMTGQGELLTLKLVDLEDLIDRVVLGPFGLDLKALIDLPSTPVSADFILFNWLLLALYIGARVILVLIAALGGFPDVLPRAADDTNWFERQRRGAQKPVYLLMMLAAIALIAWLPVLYERLPLDGAELPRFLWVAPFVVLFELGANAMPSLAISTLLKGFSFRRKAETPISYIPGVYDAILQDYGDTVIGARRTVTSPVLEASADAAKEASHDEHYAEVRDQDAQLLHNSLVKALQGLADDDRNSLSDDNATKGFDVFGHLGVTNGEQSVLFVEDSLTQAHFSMFAELIQKGALDRGEQVWVICPGHSVDEYQRGIYRALTEIGTHFLATYQTFSPDAMGINATTDIVFGSVSEFESCFERNDDLEASLSRLGIVIVMRTDLVDLGLLRLLASRLRARMKQAQLNAADMLVVSQFEPTKNLERRVLEVFSGLSAQPKTQVLTKLAHVNDQQDHVVIWRNTPQLWDLLTELVPASGLSKRALAGTVLDVLGRSTALDLALLNSSGHMDPSYWRSGLVAEVERYIANRELSEADLLKLTGVASALRDLYIPRVCLPKTRQPSVFVEDRGNLYRAVETAVRSHRGDATLLQIMMAHYPFAFVFWSILQNEAQPMALGEMREFLSEFAEPLAPKPSGGLVELSLIIGAELSAAAQAERPVSQSQVDDLFRLFEAHKTQFDIWNVEANAAGLEHLFRLVRGEGITVLFERDARYEMNYRVEDLEVLQRISTLGVTEVRRTGAAEERVSSHAALTANDYGLTYAKGTRLFHGGQWMKFDEITRSGASGFDATFTPGDPEKGVEVTPVFYRVYSLFGVRRVTERTANGSLKTSFKPRESEGHAGQARSEGSSRLSLNPYTDLNYAARTMLVERQSRAFWEVPTFEIGPDFLGSAGAQRFVARSPDILRRALLLRLEGQLLRKLADKSELLFAQIGFTLASTLQDTLATLFPNHAPRLAVLCAETTGFEQRYLSAAGDRPNLSALPDHEHFAFFRQPTLSCLSDDGGRFDPTTDKQSKALRETYVDLCSRAIGGPPPTQDSAELHLILVEDSIHDLGVVNACKAEFDDNKIDNVVLEAWTALVQHSAEVQAAGTKVADHTSFYKFGTTTIPLSYKFEFAREILQAQKASTTLESQ